MGKETEGQNWVLSQTWDLGRDWARPAVPDALSGTEQNSAEPTDK